MGNGIRKIIFEAQSIPKSGQSLRRGWQESQPGKTMADKTRASNGAILYTCDVIFSLYPRLSHSFASCENVFLPQGAFFLAAEPQVLTMRL